MLKELTVVNWIFLFIGLVLISGPGFLFIQLNSLLMNFNFLSKVILAYCLGISILSFLLSIFGFLSLGLSWNIIIVTFIICWIIFFIISRINFKITKNQIDFFQLGLLVLIIGVIFIILFKLRNIVAGLGSDSYHHTLISQLILNQGRVPNNYNPYAPIVSFSYHFGFHGLSAYLSYISGIPMRLVVPINGIISLGFASISLYFLSLQLFQKKCIALLSGILTICTSIFPNYLINFSRFPQILGLVFCSLLLGLFIYWQKNNFSISLIPIVTLITLGQGFIHYRITIMTAIGILLYLIFIYFEKKEKGTFLKENFYKWFIYGLSTLILYLPWVFQVILNQKNGFSGDIGQANEQFYSLNRLGFEIINYPTNIPILASVVLSFIFIIRKKNKNIIWLYCWTLILILFSNQYFLASFMDTISIIFSLYIPLLVISSWTLFEIINLVNTNKFLRKKLYFIFLIPMIGSIFIIPNHIHPEFSFVSPEDLVAFEWIKNNTPPESKFAVNTFNFNFNENYIIGIDAGYWIPLLTDRKAISIPMIYPIEKLESKNAIDQLKQIHKIEDYSSEDALNLLAECGITHIYLGELGSKEKLNQLQKNISYELIFNFKNSYVFKIN